jgi:hypothetical protein
MADSPHLETERLVAFLLDGTSLDPQEHFHLLRCDECRHVMTDAASEKLQNRRTEDKE